MKATFLLTVLFVFLIPIFSSAQTAQDYYTSGMEKFSDGYDDEAIADLTKAIELDPSYIYAYYNRALINAESAKYEEALPDYNKVIELDPKHVRAYNNRGSVKASLNDYKGAKKDFEQAIELDPDLAVSYYNLVDLNIAKGDSDHIRYYSEALRVSTELVERFPEDPRAYGYSGLVRNKLELYEWSVRDYNRAVELDPNYSDYYEGRGVSKLKLGAKGSACADFRVAANMKNPRAVELVAKHCD